MPKVRSGTPLPFWQRKSLAEMTRAEWESLCDGCGKCCLNKLEDEDTGDISYTDIACRLLDLTSCTCRDYANRQTHVPDCVQLTPQRLLQLRWLPSTCAYRLLSEGNPLPNWHYLVSGNRETVHDHRQSVRHRVVSEVFFQGSLEDHVVEWPE